MKVLGIIPARGGSKGIPRKNLAPVAGRSLLAWTIDAATAARSLSRLVLSTEDHEIAEQGRMMGVEVPFLRPEGLSADDTAMLPVLVDVVDRLAAEQGFETEVVVLLQPTSPLRRATHIDEAVAKLIATGADSIVSVVAVPHQFTPTSVMREENGQLRPYDGTASATRRQDKPALWARNGPAVLAVRAAVLRAGSLYGADSRPMAMHERESIDIDTAFDLELADWLLRRTFTDRSA
ncbi:MAG TPA: acylneuraminate cytidylyltransferase family protein [Vicinamibacterales bacterium]|nr:acylneuraminate cytidylyltransferase family protein [Vicinamibacterales bacterium]